MAKFTWEDEEKRFRQYVHNEIMTAMHSALACDVHPGGRGDRAAGFATERLWTRAREILARHRSETLELKGEIRRLRAQVTKLQNSKPASNPKTSAKTKATAKVKSK